MPLPAQIRVPLVLITLGLWPLALRAVGVLGDPDASPSLLLRLAGTAAMVLAPALTFWMLGRVVPVPGYALEGAGGWALLLLVLTYSAPSDPPGLGAFLLLTLPLTVALAVVAQMGAWLLGMRVYRGDGLRDDPLRIRRQGYTLALVCMVGVMLFASGTLSPATVGLLIVIAALTEALAHRRHRPRSQQAVGELHQAGDLDPAGDGRHLL